MIDVTDTADGRGSPATSSDGDPEARTILVAGTASHVGKSTVAAGLCRLLADRGVDVVPFKAQNMSNNARVARSPAGDWGEIGVSQYVQARAAGTAATTDVNPVLLKPRGDGESQLVVDGEAVTNVAAGEYFETRWQEARGAAVAAHRRLATANDVVVAEGAGSLGEPNLRHRDLANVETARFADADVVLVADIDRGGAFASLVGTIELMPEDVRERVVGAVITKFRGDEALLDPAVTELEERTGVPVLGVVPHDDPGLPEEDSVALPDVDEEGIRGADDGVPGDRGVTIAVPRLPRISNATDLGPLGRVPGVRVAVRPPDARFRGADAILLPGSKNTVDDLLALREAGFAEELAAHEGPVVGLCGGYQLLGERIENAAIEGTGGAETVDGFGRLPVVTTFSREKRVEVVERALEGSGPLAAASGTVTGYEIHMGSTEALADVARPVGPESAAVGDTLGTYLHGLFENRVAREAFVDAVFAVADRDRPTVDCERADPYDAAADLLREHVDLAALDLPGGGP